MRLGWLALVVLAGCARNGIGTQQTQIAPGDRWCSKPYLPMPDPDGGVRGERLMKPGMLSHCLTFLRYDPAMVEDRPVCEMNVEISFDAEGRAWETCLVNSSCGEHPDFTGCVMDAIRDDAKFKPYERVPYRFVIGGTPF